MIKSRKQMFIVMGVFALVLMLGTVTYAFFNYTRTGSANTIRTGRISFNHTQGEAINLTNMFPIDVTNGIPEDNTKVGTLTINVTGDTTYTEGLEYKVSAVNVTNTVGSGNNAKTLPISISVTVEDNDNNDPATSLGEESNDYYNDRGGDTSYYSLIAGDTIDTDSDLLMGYIAPGSDGVDGNIVIKAYIDNAKVGISDTYPAESTDSNSDGYIDGTPSSFGENRTIFTTTEWNSLQTNGISFQVRVESKEGTWIKGPTAAEIISALTTLEETPYGKVYTGATVNNYVIFNNEEWRIIGVYNDSTNGNVLKIIKATPYTTSQQYNSLDSNNVWNGSSMQTYLYDNYNTIISDAQSRAMIYESGKWNVGATAAYTYALEAYTDAVTTATYNNLTYTTPWVGKIGLIASYELQYAATSDCWDYYGNNYSIYGGMCGSKDWLFSTIVNTSNYVNAWTISPGYYFNDIYSLTANPGGVYYAKVTNSFAVSPVVYLKPEVTITGGTGEYGGNEYTLGYTAS